MSNKAERYANRLLREREAAMAAVEEPPVVAQTPGARYEAAHGLTHWYTGSCQCSVCVKAHGTTRNAPLVNRYGKPERITYEGSRVPHVATMLVVRRSWNLYTMTIERRVLGTIEYGDYLLGRTVGMTEDEQEIAEATEPARVVTGGRVKRGDVLDAKLTIHRHFKARTVVLKGHCGICHEPKEPGKSYCMTCRHLLARDGGEAELAKRMAQGEKRRAESR